MLLSVFFKFRHRYARDEVLELLVVLGTYDKDVVGVYDHIVFKAFDRYELFLFRRHNKCVSDAFHESLLGAYGIPVAVLRYVVVERFPCSNVLPSEFCRIDPCPVGLSITP